MMEKAPWGSRIFLRYLLYQIPGWGLLALFLLILRKWIFFPWWVFPGALILLVFKDLVLFPYLWRAYGAPSPKRPLPGSLGVVVKSLSPEGYIRIDGELWRAEVRSRKITVLPGDTVEVKGNEGLTLLVDPASKEAET